MALSKSKRNNLIFLVAIALLIIPQTRKPIQIVLNKGLSLFSPRIIDENKRDRLDDYNWQLQDLNGEYFDFNKTQGQVSLVNLWATWCPPCIAELPGIEDLYADYSDKINFLLVSNEDQEVVKAFFERKGYDLNSYQPISDYPERLVSRSIPKTFLIDKQGRIVIEKSGAADWNSSKVRQQIDDLLLE